MSRYDLHKEEVALRPQDYHRLPVLICLEDPEDLTAGDANGNCSAVPHSGFSGGAETSGKKANEDFNALSLWSPFRNPLFCKSNALFTLTIDDPTITEEYHSQGSCSWDIGEAVNNAPPYLTIPIKTIS